MAPAGAEFHVYQCKALQSARRHNTSPRGVLSCVNSWASPETTHRWLAGLPRPSSCAVIGCPVIMATVMDPIAVCIFVAISIASLHAAEGLSHCTWASLTLEHDIRQAGRVGNHCNAWRPIQASRTPGAEEALAALLEPGQAVSHVVPQGEDPQRWHSCGHHPGLELSRGPGQLSFISVQLTFTITKKSSCMSTEPAAGWIWQLPGAFLPLGAA